MPRNQAFLRKLPFNIGGLMSSLQNKIVLVFAFFCAAQPVLSAENATIDNKAKHEAACQQLKDDLKSGKIDVRVFADVAQWLKDGVARVQEAEQEYKDLTLYEGYLMAPLIATGFRIGLGTCSVFGGVPFLTIEPTVKTKNLVLTIAAAALIGVAYKKGYFAKMKQYIKGSNA